MINIIDVGLGNICSLENWLRSAHLFSKRVSHASDFSEGWIILPGVASAKAYMSRLKERKLDQEIVQRAEQGQKILGICLGFQIMTTFSEEDGGVECLGLLQGKTRFLARQKTHNGWHTFSLNRAEVLAHHDQICLPIKKKKVITGRVYYNHSLEVKLENEPESYVQTLESGITSLAFKNNLFGVQFHPEKSQQTGKEVLRLLI